MPCSLRLFTVSYLNPQPEQQLGVFLQYFSKVLKSKDLELKCDG